MTLDQDLALIRRNANKVVKQLNRQAAKTINHLATKARNQATKNVAKDIGVPVKTLKGRTRQSKHQRATATKLRAQLRVNVSPLPLIRLLERKANRVWEGRGAIMVGKYAVQRGFIQTLANGRTHVMQRAGRARYSIDVVKIPLRQPLTTAYQQALKDYPIELQKELKGRLSAVFS